MAQWTSNIKEVINAQFEPLSKHFRTFYILKEDISLIVNEKKQDGDFEYLKPTTITIPQSIWLNLYTSGTGDKWGILDKNLKIIKRIGRYLFNGEKKDLIGDKRRYEMTRNNIELNQPEISNSFMYNLIWEFIFINNQDKVDKLLIETVPIDLKELYISNTFLVNPFMKYEGYSYTESFIFDEDLKVGDKVELVSITEYKEGKVYGFSKVNSHYRDKIYHFNLESLFLSKNDFFTLRIT